MLDGGDNFDLLFTDFVMPNGVNGAELARRALHRRPALKVLLTSGYASQVTGSEAPHVDGFAMIEKPYRMVELAARIRDMLDRIPAERAG
jgi:DNA-binding NtrC family response regulator